MRVFIGGCRPVRRIDGHCAEHAVTSLVVKKRIVFVPAGSRVHHTIESRPAHCSRPRKQEPYFYIALVTVSVTTSYKRKRHLRERSAPRLRGVVATDD